MTTTREQIARERARAALFAVLGWRSPMADRAEKTKLADELVEAIVDLVDVREADRLDAGRRLQEDVDAAAEAVLLEGTEYGSHR